MEILNFLVKAHKIEGYILCLDVNHAGNPLLKDLFPRKNDLFDITLDYPLDSLLDLSHSLIDVLPRNISR